MHEARNRKTGKSYAVKKMTKQIKASELANIRLEIGLMSELKNKHIVRLKNTFEDPHHIFVVMEKLVGGELFDRIAAKEYFNEKEARDACQILFDTMGYCHRRKIAHRDLKPEK